MEAIINVHDTRHADILSEAPCGLCSFPTSSGCPPTCPPTLLFLRSVFLRGLRLSVLKDINSFSWVRVVILSEILCLINSHSGMPVEVASLPFFDHSNRAKWVCIPKYTEYINAQISGRCVTAVMFYSVLRFADILKGFRGTFLLIPTRSLRYRLMTMTMLPYLQGKKSSSSFHLTMMKSPSTPLSNVAISANALKKGRS